MFDAWRGFRTPELPPEWHGKLTEMARQARGDILKMTTLAGSGHPGGSMSSLEIFITLYNMAKVDPRNPRRDDRDRIIVSHGHTSPGVYTALAQAGFFDSETAVCGFRQGKSPFEGHVEQSVPGIEWDTGNLGQGLSVGVGRALYGRLSGQTFHTYVVMGDGEQQKGQIAEARCQAAKYKLSRLTAIIDWNRLQISGDINKVMPQNIRAVWEADGWQVVEVDAHDLNSLYDALRKATHGSEAPVMILARSVMGKGVSFMENQHKYHGSALKPEQLADALKELGGIPNNYPELVSRRKQGPPPRFKLPTREYPQVNPGSPIIYNVGDKSDNRGAWGKALLSVADANMGSDKFMMGVFDCDLSGSVKTDAFAAKYPDNFFQFGITEHSTAVVAGSLSAERALSVWADFGMFGVAESYNQARLNDINHANVKLFCTHSGVNVGEDGKTHQSIDYFGLLNSTIGWKVITPADPNQTDRVTRYVLSTPGNFAVVMGRSIVPIVTDEAGRPYFGEQYRYRYGRMEQIRTGRRLVLVSAGNMLPYALDAWQMLAERGKRVALVSVSDWSDLHADDLAMIGGFESVVTLEDHNVKTGLGATVAAALFETGYRAKFIRLGVTEYASSGTPEELYKLLGLDPESVVETIESVL
jgi:transketolase